jgi:hypothetical protein
MPNKYISYLLAFRMVEVHLDRAHDSFEKLVAAEINVDAEGN